MIQHIGAQEDAQPQTKKMENEHMRMFIHGADQENNHMHGGVAIALSSRAVKAWKRAGSVDPITSGMFSGTARYMSLDLG